MTSQFPSSRQTFVYVRCAAVACAVAVPVGFGLAFGLAFGLGGHATAADKLIATVAGPDFQVGSAGTVQVVEFATREPVTGIGFTALWSAVVADLQNGVAPWSLDLGVNVTTPGGVASGLWKPIGGDVTIASYPLQDFKPVSAWAEGENGTGTFTWSFSSIAGPWVAGLSDVQYHLTTTVPDVEQEFTGSVAEGPLWHRPFFIGGISGLGPVVYDALEFTVSVSGGYEIESVVPVGNNFAYLYRGGFDPQDPLTNLLDYGLGNGFAPNGSPQGTSRISAMLFEGETYHLVVSQWAASTPGQPYVNTIVGPGEFIVVGAIVGDLDGNGIVDGADLGILLAAWGPCPGCDADLNGDGVVDGADIGILLQAWTM